MKKLRLVVFTVTSAASVFGQTILFNTSVPGTYVQHVYAPLASNLSFSQVGCGSADTPAGTNNWAGFSLIGINGTGGQYGGSNTLAQLIGTWGFNQPESSLVPGSPVTTFRTGAAAGFVAAVTSTLPTEWDGSQETVEMVAWDNSSGLYSTWTDAYPAWTNGLIAAGESGRWNTRLAVCRT